MDQSYFTEFASLSREELRRQAHNVLVEALGALDLKEVALLLVAADKTAEFGDFFYNSASTAFDLIQEKINNTVE